VLPTSNSIHISFDSIASRNQLEISCFHKADMILRQEGSAVNLWRWQLLGLWIFVFSERDEKKYRSGSKI
jgi:hypothetical protein